jgi:2-phosphosulfolactate phosphatase
VHLDVSLAPALARIDDDAVLIVIDQIRASTTLTTLLDAGCPDVLLAGNVTAARRLAREVDALLAGEWRARKPAGFDFDNSPSEIARADVRGRPVVLSTTNGTAVLHRVRGARHVLVGCLRNAGACARAALAVAEREGVGIRIVCAGRHGRFVLEDAVAAGEIAKRILAGAAERGLAVDLTDSVVASIRLRDAEPDPVVAMTESDGGRTLRAIDHADDIAYVAAVDATTTVPALVAGPPMRVVRWEG